MLLPPPTPTLFPYTTLFRSSAITRAGQGAGQYPAYYEHRHLPHLCGSLSAQPRWYPSGDDFDGPTTESRSEEHTSELQSRGHLVCRLLLEKKKKKHTVTIKH